MRAIRETHIAVAAPPQGTQQLFVVVSRIHDPTQGELFGVAHALNHLCLDLGLAQRWQEQRGQNRDDGNHDE